MLEKLTKREYEILCHLAHGKQNKEIAHLLSIAPHTIEKHLCHIYQKLNITNRTEATTLYWQAQAPTKNTGNPV